MLSWCCVSPDGKTCQKLIANTLVSKYLAHILKIYFMYLFYLIQRLTAVHKNKPRTLQTFFERLKDSYTYTVYHCSYAFTVFTFSHVSPWSDFFHVL